MASEDPELTPSLPFMRKFLRAAVLESKFGDETFVEKVEFEFEIKIFFRASFFGLSSEETDKRA